jgi:hypothetical protein
MIRHAAATFECIGIALGVIVLLTRSLAADAPADVAPSAFAPREDLRGQIESFVEELEDDLEEEAEYTESHRNRVELNASTLVVLGQTLGMHNEDDPLKASASQLIEASLDLFDNADDFAAARESLADVKAALTSQAGGEVDWEPLADLPSLMKQVPIVNNSLRRGVMGRRFERMIDRSAGEATTLAAIAHVSMYCLDYCGDEEDEALWKKVCADMRDAAIQVRVAVRRNDKESAVAGLAKLVETCDACHDTFR